MLAGDAIPNSNIIQSNIIEKIAISLVNVERTNRGTAPLKNLSDLRSEDSDMFLSMAEAAFKVMQANKSKQQDPFMENVQTIDLEVNSGIKINGSAFVTKQFNVYPELKQQLHAFFKISNESDVLLVSLPGAHPAGLTQSPQEYKLPYRIPGMRLAMELKQFNHLVFSDPGHFIGGLAASFFIGGSTFNMFDNIVKFVDLIVEYYGFPHDKVIFMGGSAGGFAAFQASTYSTKYNKAFILNQQVSIHDYVPLNKYDYFSKYFNLSNSKESLSHSPFADRFCCINRAEKIDITNKSYYFLCNFNDPHYSKNILLQEKIQHKCRNFVFDKYNGPQTHAAPDYEFFREKVISAVGILNNKYDHSANKPIVRGE